MTHSFEDQVGWLLAAYRARAASIRRHAIDAGAGTDWAVFAADIPAEAPGWVTAAAVREFLRRRGTV